MYVIHAKHKATAAVGHVEIDALFDKPLQNTMSRKHEAGTAAHEGLTKNELRDEENCPAVRSANQCASWCHHSLHSILRLWPEQGTSACEKQAAGLLILAACANLVNHRSIARSIAREPGIALQMESPEGSHPRHHEQYLKWMTCPIMHKLAEMSWADGCLQRQSNAGCLSVKGNA